MNENRNAIAQRPAWIRAVLILLAAGIVATDLVLACQRDSRALLTGFRSSMILLAVVSRVLVASCRRRLGRRLNQQAVEAGRAV